MMKLILVLVFAFVCTSLSATVVVIDSNLSVDIPGEVVRYDTTVSGVLSESFSSEVNSEVFVVARSVVMNDDQALLAEDEEGLIKQYQSTVDKRLPRLKKKEYLLEEASSITIGNFLWYEDSYLDESTKEKIMESRYLQINGVLYIFGYANRVDFNEEYKDLFFNSIVITNPEEATQYVAEEPFISIGTWIGLGLGLVYVSFFFFIKKGGKHAKWGITLKLPDCPSCGLKQPRFRKPKNERELMWGGYTCSKCGTEMDKYGSKIEG